jgi:hypothetical protein
LVVSRIETRIALHPEPATATPVACTVGIEPTATHAVIKPAHARLHRDVAATASIMALRVEERTIRHAFVLRARVIITYYHFIVTLLYRVHVESVLPGLGTCCKIVQPAIVEVLPRLRELHHGRLQIVERTFNQQILILAVNEQVVPERLLRQYPARKQCK